MAGHVRKRGTKWSFVIELQRDEVTGKRQQKWYSGYKTKKEAEKALIQKLNELNNGTYIKQSKETFGEYMLNWLETKKSNLKPSTYRTYAWLIQNHIVPGLGKHELLKLTPLHIEKFYSDLHNVQEPLADQVISKIHTMIRSALTKASRWGMIPKNAADLVDHPRFKKKQITVWDDHEVLEFLDVAREDRLYIAFLLAVTTGMRRGEILGVRWRDIDFERGVLSVMQTLSNNGDEFQETKTLSGQRAIALPDETIWVLKKVKSRVMQERLAAGPAYEDNDLVVCTSVGTKVLPRNLMRTWYRLCKKTELPRIRFHDLRHTHATLLLKQNVNPKIVSERLGHANIRITLDTYSHVLPNLQEEAAKQFGQALFSKKQNALVK